MMRDDSNKMKMSGDDRSYPSDVDEDPQTFLCDNVFILQRAECCYVMRERQA